MVIGALIVQLVLAIMFVKTEKLVERAAELLRSVNSGYPSKWNEQRDQWLKDAGVQEK